MADLKPRIENQTALLDELAQLRQENALLRQAIDERSIAPGTRRWIGRAMAALILGIGIGVGALYLAYDHDVIAFRHGAQAGWHADDAASSAPAR